jgi:hypothetical protein
LRTDAVRGARIEDPQKRLCASLLQHSVEAMGRAGSRADDPELLDYFVEANNFTRRYR